MVRPPADRKADEQIDQSFAFGLFDIHRIDHANHYRANRRFRIAKNLPRPSSFIQHQHLVPHARFNRGHGNQIAASRLTSRVSPIDHQQPPMVITSVVDRRNNFTSHLSQKHGSNLQYLAKRIKAQGLQPLGLRSPFLINR